MPRDEGFTLIELLITISLIAVVLGLAMPGFKSFRDTLAQRQATSQLINDLRTARQTSVTRHRSVVVAFGNGSVTTNITNYTLLTDLDGDGVADVGEPQLYRALPKRVQIANVAFSPTPSKLTFDTSGMLLAGSSGAG